MSNRERLIAGTAAGIDPAVLLNPDRIITERELATWVRLSERTLQRERLEGSSRAIPFVSLGGRRIGYRVGDVLDWIKRRTFNSTSARTVATENAAMVAAQAGAR